LARQGKKKLYSPVTDAQELGLLGLEQEYQEHQELLGLDQELGVEQELEDQEQELEEQELEDQELEHQELLGLDQVAHGMHRMEQVA